MSQIIMTVSVSSMIDLQ